jgi:hypothetical protein
MADPFLTLGRVIMLILVPVALMFPLVFTALVPNRAADDIARIKGRGLMLVLALSTLVLLAVWLGLLLIGVRTQAAGNLALIVANFWWPWFFPLWFFLALPAITAKNPGWGWVTGAGSGPGGLRSASLVNRERRSPVTRAMWVIPVAVFALTLGAIAARGLMPFPMGTHVGGSALDPDAARSVYAASEQSRWVLALVVYGPVFGILLSMLPRSLRRTLSEPEPMDVAGSAELSDLYERQRRKRVLGLFWGCGTVLPLFIGSFAVLQVWLPNEGSLWGLAGGIGGSLLGICGAIFGTWMTVERAKIAAVRARIEQASSIPG